VEDAVAKLEAKPDGPTREAYNQLREEFIIADEALDYWHDVAFRLARFVAQDVRLREIGLPDPRVRLLGEIDFEAHEQEESNEEKAYRQRGGDGEREVGG
jgi:hypothetical protein